MTTTYTVEVANSSLVTFLKLLRRWKGSIYKLLWKDFVIFVLLYYFINLIYRFALNDSQKRQFEKFSLYCDANKNLIPVAFVLGFYVSVIVTRWWDQINAIPWPDRMGIFISASISGHDERARLMRRTIMRYCNLAFVLTFSSISPPVKKRFPTIDHITDAGIMTKQEQEIFENIKTPYPKYFVPLVWATSLVSRARKEMWIKDDMAQQTIIHEINSFRGGLGTLFNYDWLSMPLVYTQVVTLAVQMFALSCLMGRQFIDPEQGYQGRAVDFYIPIFMFLQYFFYMGWLKVAESLINPFGEDDDDFEVNSTIDRNMQVSYLIVDEMHSEHPDLIKDQYWDDVRFEMPYTAAAEQFKTDAYLGSTSKMSVSPTDAEFVPQMERTIEQKEAGEATPTTDISSGNRIPSERRLKRQTSVDSRTGGSNTTNTSQQIESVKSPPSESARSQEEDIIATTGQNFSKVGEDTCSHTEIAMVSAEDTLNLTPRLRKHTPPPEGIDTTINVEPVPGLAESVSSA